VSPLWKTVITAAAGAATPVALDTMRSCGSDMQTLMTQSAAVAILAVGALFVQSPKKAE
jgi:hypothetical protein